MDSEALAALVAKSKTSQFDAKDVEITVSLWKESDYDGRVEILRILRNACACSPPVQAVIEVERAAFLNEVLELFDGELNSDSIVLYRCALQFLHNLFVNNYGFLVNNVSKFQDIFRQCLDHEDSKIRDYSSSIVLQALKSEATPEEFLNNDVLSLLVKACIHTEDSEFALLAVSHVIKEKADYLMSVYSCLEPEERTFLLGVLLSLLEEGNSVDAALVDDCLKHFKRQSAQLLTTMKNPSFPLEPEETLALLRVICELAGAEATRQSVQDDKSILIDSVYLLRLMHDMGKNDGVNVFTPVKKLSELPKEENGFVESSPVFGFKRDLIRLIANMVWEHKENQDQVRDIDGISLLLDCSPIDGKNPFIMQWVVVAIRNLCKNNPENQNAIRQIDSKGTVVATLAEELGLKLDMKR